MIISHKYKFIFIKTKITAGTNIEISLSRYCGPDDIITPIAEQDEVIRSQVGRQPQNYSGFYNHMSAQEIKEIVGDHVWSTYYTFGFERNPWDKVISLYYHQLPQLSKKSFDYFMEQKRYVYAYNYPLYTINDQLALNFIGQYTTLDHDLLKVCRIIGIPFDGWLPRAKGDFRNSNKDYQSYYTPLYKSKIEHFFKKEIDLFHYTFRP